MSTKNQTKINRQLMSAIRVDLDAAVVSVADKYGISVKCGRGTYDRDGSTGFFKLELGSIQDGQVMTKEAAEFKECCEWALDVKADALFTEVTYKGTTYRIAGLNMRARKMPVVLIRVSDGGKYKWSKELLQRVIADEFKVEPPTPRLVDKGESLLTVNKDGK